jgi:hypothetical protein
MTILTLRTAFTVFVRRSSIAVGLVTLAAVLAGPPVTVLVSPSPSPDVGGYAIFYGPVGGTTTNLLRFGPAPITATNRFGVVFSDPGATTTNVDVGVRYWFYAIATNAPSGLASDPSVVAFATIPLGPTNLMLVR